MSKDTNPTDPPEIPLPELPITRNLYQFYEPNRRIYIGFELIGQEAYTRDMLRNEIAERDNFINVLLRQLILDDDRALLLQPNPTRKQRDRNVFPIVLSAHLMDGSDVDLLVNQMQDLILRSSDKKVQLGKNITITFAARDWAIGGASDATHVPPGSPGTYPIPAEPIAYGAPAPIMEPTEKFRIYIIDTLPQFTEEEIQSHPVLRDWWHQVECHSIDEILAYHKATDGYQINEPQQTDVFALKQKFDTAYAYGDEQSGKYDRRNRDLQNHGLFIADIIHRLVPEAKLILVEVMNKYTHGHITTFAAVMQWLHDEVQKYPEDIILINFSFACKIPIGDHNIVTMLAEAKANGTINDDEERELKDTYGPNVISNMEILESKGYYDEFLKSQASMLNLFSDLGQDIIFIAAAGNDSPSADDRQRKRPQFPARVSAVWGVGGAEAITPQARYVDYSNWSDEPNSDGFVAWGGSRRLFTDYTNSKLYIPDKGIVGVYPNGNFGYLRVDKDAPSPQGTGFAEWSGTSFAAARLTGLLAAEVINSRASNLESVVRALREKLP